MKQRAKKTVTRSSRETLTEAYEVRAFRDESEAPREIEAVVSKITHPKPGALQAVKKAIKGHGEQTVLPDDCQFGDNDMCDVEE